MDYLEKEEAREKEIKNLCCAIRHQIKMVKCNIGKIEQELADINDIMDFLNLELDFLEKKIK